ncbi:MAG: V-type ATP synthase subunit E [Synergistaceae bacterium]|jgi:V/A-type H+-transporting ATPase subunit E|nr:V-type ATP synthase subunit E [Synergistaceae bacterium]
MSLADIKAKISADAEARVKAIESDGARSVESVMKKADDEIRAARTSYKERFAKEGPEILRRREIVAGLDAAKIDLGVKQRLVSEAFAGALRILSELPREKYLSFVQSLMERAASSDDAVLFVGNNEQYIDGAWLDSYNASHSSRVSFAPERLPIRGGFVLRRGKIDVNCSWEMLVTDARPDLEADVVKQLFDQRDGVRG